MSVFNVVSGAVLSTESSLLPYNFSVNREVNRELNIYKLKKYQNPQCLLVICIIIVEINRDFFLINREIMGVNRLNMH